MKPTFRASSADRVFGCSGSVTLIESLQLPPDTEGAAITWSGNWCHWEAAKRLIAEHGAFAGTPMPEWPPGVPLTYVPTHFDRRNVEYYLRTVLDYIGPDMAIEVEGELIYDIGPCILSGHPDILAISSDGKRGLGADFKRGHIVVDRAEGNWQIGCYAGLAKLAYPQLEHLDYLIIQPAIVETEGVERVTFLAVEGDELTTLPRFLAERFADALARPRELETGWKQCRYCPAANHFKCPALLAEVIAMKHNLTDEELARATREKDPNVLARFYLAHKLIEPLAKKAGAALKDMAVAAGGTLETTEATFGTAPWSGKRKVEPAQGFNRLCDLFPEEAERVYRCIEVSATAIEEEVADAFKLPMKTSKKDAHDARKEYAARFGDITEQAKSVALRIIG